MDLCNRRPRIHYHVAIIFTHMNADTDDEDVPPLPPPMPSLEEIKKAQSESSCGGAYY